MHHRILVVDDEQDIIALLRRSLEMEKYEVWEARDGMAALRTLQRGLPDLVLLDVNMPSLDGFETCRKIRDMGMRMPVIMLTAQTQLDYKVRGLDCGADDYMGKPFDVAELVARVRAHLRRAEDARASAQDLIRHKWEEINEGLMLAQALQQPFQQRRQLPGLRTAVRHVPVGRIGGDFYNVLRLESGESAFLIGDAVGKGLGATLLMASVFSLLMRLLAEERSPSRIMSRANSSLRNDFADLGIFVATFVGVWDPRTHVLTYCNAGHQSPIVFRRRPTRRLRHSRHQMLDASGYFLGAFDDGAYEERVVQLQSGDRLFFYTDGLADLRDGDGRVIDMRRIYRRMLRSWHLPVDSVVAATLDAFGGLALGGVTMRDDLTAMLIEIETDPAGS